MKKYIKIIANLNIAFGIVLIISPVLILLGYVVFVVPAKVDAQYDPTKENDIIARPIFNEPVFKDPFADLNSDDIAPLDFFIPNYEATDIGTRIQIPSIGLNTTVFESKDPSFGLGAGVWRDPLYGVPDRKNSGPIVLAAHRWGEDRFSWEYRYENLFTKFNELKTGDVVEITWNGRLYRYQIREVEQNTFVSNTADLIMYTCVYYNSPERIFVYADLIR